MIFVGWIHKVVLLGQSMLRSGGPGSGCSSQRVTEGSMGGEGSDNNSRGLHTDEGPLERSGVAIDQPPWEELVSNERPQEEGEEGERSGTEGVAFSE